MASLEEVQYSSRENPKTYSEKFKNVAQDIEDKGKDYQYGDADYLYTKPEGGVGISADIIDEGNFGKIRKRWGKTFIVAKEGSTQYHKGQKLYIQSPYKKGTKKALKKMKKN